jgi:hypothetical protein
MLGNSRMYCGQDLKWTPAAPTCHPIVRCDITVDNWLFDVFVDGQRIRRTTDCSMYPAGENFYCNTVVTFSAAARVLGMSAGDGETGCKTGHFAFACTSTHQSAWTGVTSTHANLKALGSLDKNKVRGGDWSVFDSDAGKTAAKWPKAFADFGSTCFAYVAHFGDSQRTAFALDDSTLIPRLLA